MYLLTLISEFNSFETIAVVKKIDLLNIWFKGTNRFGKNPELLFFKISI